MSTATYELLGFRTAALIAELDRRAAANRAGKCDACGAWYDTEPCWNLRHDAAAAQWIGRWHVETGSSYLTVTAEHYANTHLSISRYGDRVVLFRERNECARTLLHDRDMPDRQRCEWAVAWAERHLSREGTKL